MLDARSERTLADVTERLRALCGERLLCLALYGSGIGSDYVAGVSDLNLVIVLTQIDRTTLTELRAQIKAWHKLRVATPLVIDESFLRAAADVFPIELHDIKDGHRLLAGQDVFAALEIHDHNLRHQLEHEARGKLLRLRELYLEVGDNRGRLQELMLDSLTTFLTVMRTVVRMRGTTSVLSAADTFDRFCQDFTVSLPTISRLLQVKLGREPWPGNTEDVFHAYVGEVERVVQIVDQVTPGD
jgi:hypothetical protein